MIAFSLTLIFGTLLGYGLSIAFIADGLVWFWDDTREELPAGATRTLVRSVILLIAPILAAVKTWHALRDRIHHQRVRRAIRRLPTQAHPEQQHLVDELQHPDFYDRIHHPAGDLGGTP
ncbi:cytochrome bd-type quinol oxidase subunit 2 [Streptacidiphilus sp. MAP12-33]|uniref:hypothetical protein n=1 Tax=Streptacidiphilus sp. MAP12-33 TaxID=3156266 RepID=UPI0035187EA9